MEWNTEHDTLLLQEILVNEPFEFKPSTRERGQVWEKIAGQLNEIPAFKNRLKKRSVRDRYTLLSKKYIKKMADEEKATGISPPETTEIEKLIEEIIEKFDEGAAEESENKKKEKEKAKATEMRNRSMENLGETKKRNASEEDDDVISPKRKRSSGTETIVYLREKAEREFEMRKEELEVKRKEQDIQQKIHDDAQKQQQLLQQQQSQLLQHMQQQQQQQLQQQQQQQQLQLQQQMLQTKLLMSLVEKLNKE